MLKKFLKYWLPPLLLMALIFPLGNKGLGSSRLFHIFARFVNVILPEASVDLVKAAYIIIRKISHFLAYGFLALLFFRAVRGDSKIPGKKIWIYEAGAMAGVYGLLDELLQTVVPTRSGSPFDWIIDVAGILTTMLVVSIYSGQSQAGSGRPGIGAGCPGTLFFKRTMDLILAAGGLVASLPLSALFALLIWLEDGGPVFYAQERIGRNGHVFKAFKFRSMISGAEKETGPVQAAAGDQRVTRIGRVLRATALDELPQLFNILKGDMSFVGPRALRPAEKEVHGQPGDMLIEKIPGFAERHAVRPGLTGLAQVYLPADTPRRKKFRYDVFYIRKMNPAFDLKLFFLSFWITFRGKWEAEEDKV